MEVSDRVTMFETFGEVLKLHVAKKVHLVYFDVFICLLVWITVIIMIEKSLETKVFQHCYYCFI